MVGCSRACAQKRIFFSPPQRVGGRNLTFLERAWNSRKNDVIGDPADHAGAELRSFEVLIKRGSEIGKLVLPVSPLPPVPGEGFWYRFGELDERNPSIAFSNDTKINAVFNFLIKHKITLSYTINNYSTTAGYGQVHVKGSKKYISGFALDNATNVGCFKVWVWLIVCRCGS